MELVVLLSRLALVFILILSATAKFSDKAGARQAVQDFGIPAAFAPAVASILGPLELLSALLLFTTGWGVIAGALLAVGLLTAFTVGIVVNLLRGNRVDCHCFGALSQKPVTWWSVLRNLLLIGLAGVVLSAGSHQGFPWQELDDVLSPLSTAEAWLTIGVLILAAATVALASMFFQLLQRYGRVLLRIEALEGGDSGHHHGHTSDFEPWPAPPLSITDASGADLTLADVAVSDRASLFLFVSPNCGGCGELIDDLTTWQADASGPNVVVLSPGERDAISKKFGDVGVHVHNGSAMGDYRIEYTPGAVVVSTDGYVTVPPSYGSVDIRRLYGAISGRGVRNIDIGPPPVRDGDLAPNVEVEVDGVRMPIAQAAGDDSVLLFWDTTCGFCQQIVDDVARRQDTTPLLLVLRGNDVDTVRASGLTAPIAIDPSFAVGSAFQAPGTPVAVRLRDGKVASTVAVGGPEVLDLMAAVRVMG